MPKKSTSSLNMAAVAAEVPNAEPIPMDDGEGRRPMASTVSVM